VDKVSGPTPWAIVLCRFRDIRGFEYGDKAFDHFWRMYTEAGKGQGGLYDYWHDASYGTISLTGTEVFGPWDMQYSFGVDWKRGRWDFAEEARRLITVNSPETDVSKFYGFIAVVNAIVDGSSSPISGGSYGVVVTSSRAMDQRGWYWCAQCYGLWFGGAGAAGVCPKPAVPGGGHTRAGSGEYIVLHGLTGFAGQAGWTWCRNCQVLWLATGSGFNRCPAVPGPHVGDGSYNYQVPRDLVFPGTGGPGAQAKWRWCLACSGLWFGGAISDPTNPSDPGKGSCPATLLGHVLESGASDKLGNYDLLVVDSDYNKVEYPSHEMGHGYGLDHANLAAPYWTTARSNGAIAVVGTEYLAEYDPMGSDAHSYDFGSFQHCGPASSGVNRDRLGWIPDTQIAVLDDSLPVWPAYQEFALTAVDHPDGSSALLAKLVRPERVVTFEVRKPTVPPPPGTQPWDRGLPRDGVVIHELRPWFSFGQQQWKYCNNCTLLAFAGSPDPGVCVASDSGHDFSASGDYSLVQNAAIPFDCGYCTDEWRWCNRCQSLNRAGLGVCAAGGAHDTTGSGAYALLYGNFAECEHAQNGWRECTRCGCLFYAGGKVAACAAGGWHTDVTSAGLHGPNHQLPNNGDFTHSTLLPAPTGTQDWQVDDTFQHDAANLRMDVDRWDPATPVAYLHFSRLRDEQPDWLWCDKCSGLMYCTAPDDPSQIRNCPAGGLHNLTNSIDHRVTMDTPAADGQSNWRRCAKCLSLVFAGNTDPGWCSQGDQHDVSGSPDYTLRVEKPGVAGQSGWRWCNQCQGLWWWGRWGRLDFTHGGHCPIPAGYAHSLTGSDHYQLGLDATWPGPGVGWGVADGPPVRGSGSAGGPGYR
jgi:hypothetical protein